MGYISIRKCILIEIRTKFNLILEKEWIGDTISNICKRYGGRADTRRKESKDYPIFLKDLIISSTRR
jgi:hypothetical protein